MPSKDKDRTKENLQSYSDTALCGMIRLRGADGERAFGELYFRYAQKLHNYTLKVTSSYDKAKDIFQETWMRFHHSLLANDEELRNVQAFIFRIARNLCLNDKRDTREFVTVEDFQASDLLMKYEQRELLSLIDRALELLSVESRDAFILHEMEGFSYEEMSLMTGESAAALKTRVWRARNSIKEILSPFIEELQ